MNIYNSVLLDPGGIIQQVRTTFAAQPVPLPIEKYISLYTFSICVEAGFAQSFLPFRFHVDEGNYAGLLEVIMAGSYFIDRRQHAASAELVIAFANGEYNDEAEMENILRHVLQDRWRVLGWRKATVCNNEMIAISVGK